MVTKRKKPQGKRSRDTDPTKKVLSVRKYKCGYEVRTELIDWGHGDPVEMKNAYTPRGSYIGSSVWGHRLVAKRGIKPQLVPGASVCSIGFCSRDGRWYGWSHRAICGFGIGDRVFEQKYGDDDTPYVQHGHEIIVTLAQARKAATRFANYVS